MMLKAFSYNVVHFHRRHSIELLNLSMKKVAVVGEINHRLHVTLSKAG